MEKANTVWKSWPRRLQRDIPVAIALSLLAVLAVLSGLDTVTVLMVWGLAIYFVISRKPPVEIKEPSMEIDVIPDRRIDEMGAVMAALDMPAYLLNSDGIVISQNPAAVQAFTRIPDGAHLSARLRSPGLLDMVRETLVTGQPSQIEHSERVPSEHIYQVRIAPVIVPQSGVSSENVYLLSFRDISETRRIDRMRSDFVANASHELRTPLASMRGFIETLQGPARNDPKVHERFLGIMLDQVTRMSRLVDDLLSLSRLELKARIAPEEKVELNVLLGSVQDSLGPLAKDLAVDIRLHLPEHPVVVVGDRDELIEVFENLIENACKYGQEGKKVDVRLTSDPGKPVEVAVTDFGPGIQEEHLPRLTERFYRANVEASRSKKGTGLGLAIVKHILTRHRARLLVVSEIGKGTTFTVRF